MDLPNSSAPATHDVAVETVTALTNRIKAAFAKNFTSVFVEGEVSGLKISALGHAYFNLKDAGAILPCVWYSFTRYVEMRGILAEGAKIRVRGGLDVYPPRGAYQLSVSTAMPVGMGEQLIALEMLKRRLQAEGLFDPARKRQIPRMPRCVGVVTARTGAVFQDILKVTRERFPGQRIVLAPALVQGDQAAEQIVQGIANLNAMSNPPDVIIVGRGGGSKDDLNCFNDERVARAVAASRIPVIAAVGHEVDTTLTCLAADLRVATPSQAAEKVTPDLKKILAWISDRSNDLLAAARTAITDGKLRVSDLAHAMPSPLDTVHQYSQMVDEADRDMRDALRGLVADMHLQIANIPSRLEHAMKLRLQRGASDLKTASAQLAALDPSAVLSRGYAMVETPDGHVVESATKLPAGTAFDIRFADGRVHATSTERE